MNLTLYKNEIIPVYTTDLGNKVVIGKELYSYLGLKERFNDWVTRKIQEHQLVENQDYCLITEKTVTKKGRGGDRRSKKYIFRLYAAKKIALGTNNEAGDKVKDYFIACEQVVKELHNKILNTSDYAQKPIQKALVKQVNIALYDQGLSNIVEHHRDNFKIHFGCSPSKMREKLVDKGMRVKSKSGRDIARIIKPESACSMAMHDEFVSKGHDLKRLEQMKLKEKLEPAFQAIISLGYIPSQLIEKNL